MIRTGRTAVAAVVAVAVAVVIDRAVAGTPPVLDAAGGPLWGLRLVAAALVGALSCLLLASISDLRRLPELVGRLRRGHHRPVRGRGWLLARVALEEAVWRGCVLALLAAAFGVWPAVVVSSVAFGGWHLGQGWRGVLANVVQGGIFAGSYLLLGGLPAAFLSHAVHNLLLARLVLARRPSPASVN